MALRYIWHSVSCVFITFSSSWDARDDFSMKFALSLLKALGLPVHT